jgi:hypothetical protein
MLWQCLTSNLKKVDWSPLLPLAPRKTKRCLRLPALYSIHRLLVRRFQDMLWKADSSLQRTPPLTPLPTVQQ